MPEVEKIHISIPPKIAQSVFISKNASVAGDVTIGEHSMIMPGAVIRADFGYIKIGSNVWIEDNAVLHCDHPGLDIGNTVTIGHGAVVNGRCLGNRVLIGMNASICHDSEIGDNCIIAAGAVVPQGMKIPSNSFVAGVPAKVKGETSQEQMDQWFGRDEKWAEALANEYRKANL